MAKVKSIPRNNSCSFFANDASLPGLVSLEITEESPPKYDFDISLLLNDNKTCSGEQYFDNDNWSGKKIDSKISHVLSEDVCPPSSSMKTSVGSSFTSLGALAENHLKKDKMLSELCFDGDFNLSDLLSNDNCPVTNAKNAVSYENIFDLCVGTEDNLQNGKRASVTENDVPVNDLSDLVDSSHLHIFQCPVSLDSLATSHFLSNDLKSKSEKKPYVSDVYSSAFLDDILSHEKQNYVNVTPSEIVDADILIEHSSTDISDTSDEKHESSDETSDSEFFPDIDLRFCIKKTVKDELSSYTPSPESSDSGFDETDTTPTQLSISSEESVPHKSILMLHRGSSPFGREILPSSKQSLFSRAISARPKIDEARKAKLKKVRNELFKKSFPLNLIDCDQEKKSQIPQKIVDRSNDCVVTSSFLEISNEK